MLGRQIGFQKILKTSLADKTDAGAVFFGLGGQLVLFSDLAHSRLGQFAHREQCAGEFCLAHGMQEITLVFVAIQPFKQRSEEHTSELQSRSHLVSRLLLEKKNKPKKTSNQSPKQPSS